MYNLQFRGCIKSYIVLCTLYISFTSCTHETVFNEVKVNDTYSVLIPEYLSPSAKLSENASLQYQSEEREVYAMIVEESREQMQNYDLDYDLQTYFTNIVSKPFTEKIKNGKVEIPGKQDINGNNALITEITGNINNTDIYYKMAVVETPATFYQVLIWTRADRKAEYEADMMKVIGSFKELK